jgi:hypothetical protein
VARKALALLLFLAAAPLAAVDYYVIANGVGQGTKDGLSLANATFWPCGSSLTIPKAPNTGIRGIAVGASGTRDDHIYVVGSGTVSNGLRSNLTRGTTGGGIYCGLSPAWSGSAAHPIIISALNYIPYTDTDTLFYAGTNRAANAWTFDGRNYITIYGIAFEGDIGNGGMNADGNRDTIAGGGGSHNVVKQFAAWSHNTTMNMQVIGLGQTTLFSTFEDGAVWGYAKKLQQNYGSTGGNCGQHLSRRMYYDYDFSADADPKEALNINYSSACNRAETVVIHWHGTDTTYNGIRWANGTSGLTPGPYTSGLTGSQYYIVRNGWNCVWPGNQPPPRPCPTPPPLIGTPAIRSNGELYNVAGGSWSPFYLNSNVNVNPTHIKQQVLGLLTIGLPTDELTGLASGFYVLAAVDATIRDVVSMYPVGNSATSMKFLNCQPTANCDAWVPSDTLHYGNSADRLTTVGASGTITIGTKWTGVVTHTRSLSSCAGVDCYESLAGNGADLCTEWQDGVKTSQKMWPWKMNEFIRRWSILSGHDAIDVNRVVQTALGSFVSNCTDVPIAPTPTPTLTPAPEM